MVIEFLIRTSKYSPHMYLPIRICLPRMSQYDQFLYGQPMVKPHGISLFQDTLSLF